MTATYLDLRVSHYRITLGTWFRGLDKALIASASALTFILTTLLGVLLYGMARGLQLLVDSSATLGDRAAVILAWQGASLLLLRALREATFMPGARGFFDSLPIRGSQRLRADLLLSLASYSILWLPMAWLTVDPLHQSPASPGVTLLALAELATLSLCVNLTLMRVAGRHVLSGLAALAALALFVGLRAGDAPQAFARLACVLLGCAALWSSYLPGAARPARPRRRGHGGERLVLASGLVTGLLGNGLRVNLLIRLGCICATLAGCLAVIRLRTNDTSHASVLVFVAASAALALYSLPALCRNTLLGRLHFLAGQPAFARRMRFPVYAIPTMLFVIALAVSRGFDRSGTAGRDALTYGILFVLGVIGARLGWKPTTWLMPFACMIALIVLAAMT